MNIKNFIKREINIESIRNERIILKIIKSKEIYIKDIRNS